MHMHDLSGYSGDVRAVLESQFALARCMVGKQPQDWVQLDLTIGQVKTLMMLAGKPDQTVSQLAEGLGSGKPAASILIDRLVQLGLVQRTEDANDRRRTLVALTDAGSDLVARLRQGNLDQLVKWLQAMAPADLAALRRGLEALAAIAAASVDDGGDETSHKPSISVGVTSGSVHRDERHL
jgi:DNA-binding MarR family transcriptional regulator